jgi:hypothetical protein
VPGFSWNKWDAVERVLTNSAAAFFLRMESAEGKQLFYRTFTCV